MASFCSSCGTQVASGAFCQNCGAAMQPMPQQSAQQPFNPQQNQSPQQDTPMQYRQQPQYQRRAGSRSQGGFSVDVPNEDRATVTVGTLTLKVGLIVKILTLALCLFFFLPIITMSDIQDSESASPMKLVEASQLFLMTIIVPAVLFLVYLFKRSISFLNGKLFVITIVLALLGIFFYIMITGYINEVAAEMSRGWMGFANIKVSYSFWYYLTFIFYAVIGFLAIMCKRASPKATRSPPPRQPRPPQSGPPQSGPFGQ